MARGFAQAGCKRIAITDINTNTLADTRASLYEISPLLVSLVQVGNVADEAFADSLVKATVDLFGRLDYVVNCAGILGDALRSSETPVAMFDRINDVNYKGSWLVSRAALGQMVKQEPLPEHLQQRGSIVNIASQLGLVGRPEAGELPLRVYRRDETASPAQSGDANVNESPLLRLEGRSHRHDPVRCD